MKRPKAGEAYVLFGGQVRVARTFPTIEAAELARGGEPCWITITRAHQERGVTRYEEAIVPAVMRRDRRDRTHFTYVTEGGVEATTYGWTRSFPTFEAAKDHMVAHAREGVARHTTRLNDAKAELKRVLKLKAPKPGKAAQ